MNCPSKNDNVLLNPGWNQSPPRFAADLTTCQDLNGIANSRELGEADRLRSGSQSLKRCELEDNSFQEKEKEQLAIGEGAKGSYQGPCTRTSANVNNEHRGGISTTNHSFKGWATWLFSVLCTSAFLSFASGNGMPNVAASAKSVFQTTNDASSSRHHFRRDACANGSAKPNYNLSLHVAGLFIILCVSSTGCAFPILVTKFPRLRIPPSFLFSAKHFGTGVLIATSFVHLLPTAFLSLSNSCLSGFWTDDYPAMPGAIMLASIFFVTIIEMVFSPAQHVCGGNSGIAGVARGTKESNTTGAATGDAQNKMHRTYSDSSVRVREMGPLRGRMTSISRTLTKYREETQRLDAIASIGLEAPVEDSKSESDECAIEDPERNEQKTELTPEQVHKKAIMQCFLLEMGILFHSIFIGMSLSVTVGNDFVVLLIAIIFHQTFEGLALGVRIAAIEWPEHALQPWLMAIAYGCTTPLGQAIGIATHTLYSPGSEIGLLVVGIMNAISAGFLIFASLVELMSEDFLSDESWQVLRGKKRVAACLLVFFGAFLMSLVGAWA
ncbi:Zip-domain-containing protein [Dothidotthia symphoricarpi CBS 119687]|uniref:Zip-domain-containing protein n=1 Tax=Dothidotthia symphoricarpi CBS 119687 TaxID=1392245 RepID=A0A6A6AME5_9PLEO|nr:Zip-domain-containing protein [Dothidotthia symphoricarpi CBS 119687]KAF2132104.1 Zip-domain-containing protein [Dothidotthia symphoricarpi CBS 119687]